jgi:hypothetical protein
MLSKWRERLKLCRRSAAVRRYGEHRSAQIEVFSPLNQRCLNSLGKK